MLRVGMMFCCLVGTFAIIGINASNLSLDDKPYTAADTNSYMLLFILIELSFHNSPTFLHANIISLLLV